MTAVLLLVTLSTSTGLEHLPRWHMTGNEACYGFEDAKQLVLADAELAKCKQTALDITDFQNAVTALDATVDLERKRADDAQAMATKLEAQLKTCIDDKAQAQAKANSGPSVGWLVAGAAVLTLVGYVLGQHM